MFKFTVALCILQVLGQNCGTFTVNADQLSVAKYRRPVERQGANKDEIPFVVMGYGSPRPSPPWLSVFTASVIAQEWALTCGHCVESVIDPYIWYGQLPEPSKDYIPGSRVLNIYFHPAYHAYHEMMGQDRIIENNISLLRVSVINLQLYGRLLSVDYMSLLGLPVTSAAGGANAGQTNKSGINEKKHIQFDAGVIVACDEKVRGFNRHLLCVTPKCSSGDQSTSPTDAGAPLLYDGKIIAVHSYDFTDGSKVRTSFSPVSPYIDWISQTVSIK